MHNPQQFGRHQQSLPKLRTIRRSCSKELYRTIKRLNKYIEPEKIRAAEELYYKKVGANLLFIAENGSNRKKLSDWWDENVCPEIAELWDVQPRELSRAFRSAFMGGSG
jgi:toxin CptA